MSWWQVSLDNIELNSTRLATTSSVVGRWELFLSGATFLSCLQLLQATVQFAIDLFQQGDLLRLATDNLVQGVETIFQIGEANLEIDEAVAVRHGTLLSASDGRVNTIINAAGV